MSLIIYNRYGVVKMKIVVQKFGGTSLSTAERRKMVVDKITAAKNSDYKIVVIVSAMGRSGDPYSTDTLKNLVANNSQNTSPKHLDLLMSCGEIISSVVLASELESKGFKVTALTGYQAGILTDNTFGNADILSIDTTRVLNHLNQDEIVIVSGFQGATKDGETTTLGRGGSDTSAAALGMALNAEYVEIYTDVDGIMTADPNMVPKAKIIEEINYEEVFQMAEKGAQIIHPRAVEIAQNANIPLKIKNTLSNHPGTSICNSSKIKRHLAYSSKDSDQLLTAITHKTNITQVTISMDMDPDKDSKILSALAEASISIDMINFFLDKKIFTISDEKVPDLEKILKSFEVEYSLLSNCSKVTIIGSRITGIPGVMATMVNGLVKENIQILQSSDSHATISCLVKGEDTKKAVNALHHAFGLDK